MLCRTFTLDLCRRFLDSCWLLLALRTVNRNMNPRGFVDLLDCDHLPIFLDQTRRVSNSNLGSLHVDSESHMQSKKVLDCFGKSGLQIFLFSLFKFDSKQQERTNPQKW